MSDMHAFGMHASYTDELHQLQVPDRWATRATRARTIVSNEGPLALVNLIRGRGGLSYVRQITRYMICEKLFTLWDAKHSVDTNGEVDIRDVDVIGSHEDAGAAVSSSPSTFRYLSRFFPKDPASYTYVDLGAGKGRTVLLASTMGFRRVIGVEFAGALCEIATRNVQTFRHPRANPAICSIVHADASQYKLPNDNLVLYLASPFGPDVWRLFLENLAQSYRDSPRHIIMVFAGSHAIRLQRIAPLIPATGIFEGIGRGVAPFYFDTYLPIHFEIYESKAD